MAPQCISVSLYGYLALLSTVFRPGFKIFAPDLLEAINKVKKCHTVNMNFIHRISEVDGQWSDTDLVITRIYIDKTRKDVIITPRK